MTVADLQAKIKELGFPDNYFSFNGKEAWGINLCYYNYNNKWRVYSIDERGNYSNDETFRLLEDACDFVYANILKSAKYFSKK